MPALFVATGVGKNHGCTAHFPRMKNFLEKGFPVTLLTSRAFLQLFSVEAALPQSRKAPCSPSFLTKACVTVLRRDRAAPRSITECLRHQITAVHPFRGRCVSSANRALSHFVSGETDVLASPLSTPGQDLSLKVCVPVMRRAEARWCRVPRLSRAVPALGLGCCSAKPETSHTAAAPSILTQQASWVVVVSSPRPPSTAKHDCLANC